MKLFIILSLILLPSNVALATNYTLDCSEYKSLMERSERTEGIGRKLKDELLREIVKHTDPKCFS